MYSIYEWNETLTAIKENINTLAYAKNFANFYRNTYNPDGLLMIFEEDENGEGTCLEIA